MACRAPQRNPESHDAVAESRSQVVEGASPDSRVLAVAVGTAFSLWRAVFLVLPEKEPRTIDGPMPAAKTFSRKLVDTNAIGFGDERESSEWAGGYYLGNAVWRIAHLHEVKASDRFTGSNMKQTWEIWFRRLARGVEEGCGSRNRWRQRARRRLVRAGSRNAFTNALERSLERPSRRGRQSTSPSDRWRP